MKIKQTKKISFGVLSYARIARDAWLPALAYSNLAILSVLGIADPLRRKEAEKRHQGIKIVDSYDAVINDHSIDAIYIPLPNHLHAEWAVKALEHGKHVLCEKPLAHTAQDATRMKDAAVANGLVLMEALMYRYCKRTALLKQLISSGTLGEIKNMHVTFCFTLDDKADHRLKLEHGGGALLDVGIYGIDLALNLFTDRNWTVKGVSARMRNDVDLASHVLLVGDDITLNLTCGFDTDLMVMVKLQGTKGTLIMPDFFLQTSASWDIILKDEHRKIKPPIDNSYLKEIDAFVSIVRQTPQDRHPLVTDAHQLIDTIRARMMKDYY